MLFKRFLSYAAVLICGVIITTMVIREPFSKRESNSDIGLMQKDSVTNTPSNDSNGIEIALNKSATKSTGNAEVTYNTVFDKEKIIYQGEINLDVKDSEKASGEIKSYIEGNGGFIESSHMDKIKRNDNQSNFNQSYIVIRVPAAKFNETMEKLKRYGEETSTNINSTNISTQYRDIESEKNSLNIQEERLLNYLKAAEKVEDMITIESELNRVRTNLNMINNQLTNYDQLINYSNITVNITESKTLNTTIKSPFGQLLDQISKGFIHSINLLLQSISFLIVLVFRLIPFLIVIIPVWLILRKKFKK